VVEIISTNSPYHNAVMFSFLQWAVTGQNHFQSEIRIKEINTLKNYVLILTKNQDFRNGIMQELSLLYVIYDLNKQYMIRWHGNQVLHTLNG
jgi:hypothetical protein